MRHSHATVHPHASSAHGHHRHTHPVHHRGPVVRAALRSMMFAFNRFLLLPIGAVIALIWANTASESYFTFAHRLSFIVNDIGMAFFFALIMQEVVEAVMPGGALHSWRRWTVPVVAAAGGVCGAAFVYLSYINLKYETMLSVAWPVACAIDAAAAYYLLRVLMPRSAAVPFGLLLAIVTDIFGLFLVAPRRFVMETRVEGAAFIVAAVVVAVLMRGLKVRSFWPYLFVCGAVSWLGFYWAGLQPAFALVPIVPLLPHEPRQLDIFADPPDDDAVHHVEHEWHLFVQVILFFFGLVNAGVLLRSYDTGSYALLSAALVGRPLGILAGTWIALVAGLHLPRRVSWRELLVIALAASIGFPIALFFATGILATGPLLGATKIGVLGSVGGAFLAFVAARSLRVGRFAR